MRIVLSFAFIILVSCAHQHDGEYRRPSSYAELVVYGDHDFERSTVKVFPPEHHDKFTKHFFYIELKDEKGMYIDRDLHEITVKKKNKILESKVERVLRGRYYLSLLADKKLSTGQLDFYVAGKKLRESFRLGLKPAHPRHTTMKKLRASKSRAKFEIILKDENGRFVETPDVPEIITGSDAQVSKLEHIGNGVWHVTLTYPRGNQLLYITVRSYGVEFKNLFRFQYIDTE